MNTLQKGKAFKKSERNRVQKRDKKGKKKGMEIFHAEFKIRKHGFCIDMMQT